MGDVSASAQGSNNDGQDVIKSNKRRFTFPGTEITEYLKVISDNFCKSFQSLNISDLEKFQDW
jgi:hypothetical protein